MACSLLSAQFLEQCLALSTSEGMEVWMKWMSERLKKLMYLQVEKKWIQDFSKLWKEGNVKQMQKRIENYKLVPLIANLIQRTPQISLFQTSSFSHQPQALSGEMVHMHTYPMKISKAGCLKTLTVFVNLRFTSNFHFLLWKVFFL